MAKREELDIPLAGYYDEEYEGQSAIIESIHNALEAGREENQSALDKLQLDKVEQHTKAYSPDEKKASARAIAQSDASTGFDALKEEFNLNQRVVGLIIKVFIQTYGYERLLAIIEELH